MTIACRTVLDLRSPLDKYLSQTLLLAASWHRHCTAHSDLEIATIGEANDPLVRFLDEIGARHTGIPPGPNDDFSKSSNKIEAAHPDPGGRPVLLLDNDICFVGGIGDLAGHPGDAIAAAVAGSPRVADAQWECIREALNLPLLRRRFVTINRRPLVPADPADVPDPEAFLYLNSGVVLFPPGLDHRPRWLAHQRRIRDHFVDHPLASAAVLSSDQAGFATSVAEHGAFAWLPLRFNYRHGCFRLGLEPPERIRVLHLTGDIDDQGPDIGLGPRIHAYWDKFILPKIAAIPDSFGAEKTRRLEVAMTVLEQVQAVIRDYDLDHWLGASRAALRQPA